MCSETLALAQCNDNNHQNTADEAGIKGDLDDGSRGPFLARLGRRGFPVWCPVVARVLLVRARSGMSDLAYVAGSRAGEPRVNASR
jgi:hypothetical protein